MHGGNRGCARQHEPERLDEARERGGGAHRHAGAGRAGDALLELPPHALVEAAGLPLRPVFPHVCAAAEPLLAMPAGEHRAGGQEDHGQVHRDRAHEQPGHGLVAAAHQHRAVHWMAPQHLLHLEREEVAIEHRRRLHEHFGDGEHRDLHRKSARLPHAPLHLGHPLGKVRVALAQIAPRVEDRDHGPALGLVGRVAHLPQPAAVAEGAEVVGGEPALRPQVARGEASGGMRVGHGHRRAGCENPQELAGIVSPSRRATRMLPP